MKNELIVIIIDDNEKELKQTFLHLKTVAPMDQYDLNVYQFTGFHAACLEIINMIDFYVCYNSIFRMIC